MRNLPGVYRMLDAEGKLLYVGKALDLQKRVTSYFTKLQLHPRIQAMLNHVAQMEVTVTRTESEALLLENELIKSLKPRYNILLRDDKSYPYLYVGNQHEFPRLVYHRGGRSQPGKYFGPFPSGVAVKESLNLLQKLFRIRQCEDTIFKSRSRPCLQYQIGRCTAPCVGLISKEEYGRDVRHAVLFLEGKSQEVVEESIAQMDAAAARQDYEHAAMLRDQVANLRNVQTKQYIADAEEDADVLACRVDGGITCVHILFFRNRQSLGGRSYFPKSAGGADECEVLNAFVSQYYNDRRAPRRILLSHPIDDADMLAVALGEKNGHAVVIKPVKKGDKLKLVEIARRNAALAIETQRQQQLTMELRWQGLVDLLEMPGGAKRVECFDVSHTFGEATVAACVVFDQNGPVKMQYRRYNIAEVQGGDDYGAMRQALQRRFKRAVAEETAVPDVLLIDGGMGQVNVACEVLRELGLAMHVVGIAKGAERRSGREDLILRGGQAVKQPPENDPGFLLIQQIRDEAHRFAITGHRQQRQKKREKSLLEEIAGIGRQRRAALLKHFGGWAGLNNASIEEIMKVSGIHRELAKRIYASLHHE